MVFYGYLFAIRDNITRRLSQHVPAKSSNGTMCLQDNLADCADSGGLLSAQLSQCCDFLLVKVSPLIIVYGNDAMYH